MLRGIPVRVSEVLWVSRFSGPFDDQKFNEQGWEPWSGGRASSWSQANGWSWKKKVTHEMWGQPQKKATGLAVCLGSELAAGASGTDL